MYMYGTACSQMYVYLLLLKLKHCLLSCSRLYFPNNSNDCFLLPQDRLLGKDGDVSGLE